MKRYEKVTMMTSYISKEFASLLEEWEEAEKNKCDGCGSYYNKKELTHVFNQFFWCEKCIEDLNEFLTK